MSEYNNQSTSGVKFSISTQSIKHNPTTKLELLTLNEDSDLYEYEGNEETGLTNDVEEKMLDFYLPEAIDVNPAKPFSSFRDKMVDINGDGKLYKQILKAGTGEIVPSTCTLYVHYSAYYEGNEEPYDVSSLRSRRPIKIYIGESETYSDAVVGVKLGLRTMTKREICYLLIDPSLGHGKFGCAPRVPQDSWLLYRIELISIEENSGVEESYIPETFEEILEFSAKRRNEGNTLFNGNDLGGAIKIFNRTFRMLLNLAVKNDEENELRNEILLKFGRNLAVCYNKRALYKKVCCVYNELYAVAPENVKKDVKLLFLRGKALEFLGDYTIALLSLKSAAKLEPKNKQIIEEIEKVQKAQKARQIFERDFTRALFEDSVKPETRGNSDIDQEEKQLEKFIKLKLRELVHGEDTEIKIPCENEYEIELFKELSAEFHLSVRKEGNFLLISK